LDNLCQMPKFIYGWALRIIGMVERSIMTILTVMDDMFSMARQRGLFDIGL